jgi:predicted hydrocarbon binding protein
MIGFGAAANYFAKGDYYKWDMGKGVLKERGGARVMAFPQEFSIGLIAGLVEECGEAWPIVMQSCGAFWGKRQMERLDKELSTFHGARIKGLPTATVHCAISECLAVHGWGRATFDLSEFTRRVLLVRVSDSPMVAAVNEAKLDTGDKPVDALLAGALAAMFSVASGAAMECKEISCQGRGEPYCEFVIATEGRLGALGSLIRKRASRDEMLTSIALQ